MLKTIPVEDFQRCYQKWELLHRCVVKLTLRDECRLNVFENKILWRIFWRKRNEIGEDFTVRNLKVHAILRVIKSRRLRWAGNVARVEEDSLKILTGKPIGKRPLGRPGRR